MLWVGFRGAGSHNSDRSSRWKLTPTHCAKAILFTGWPRSSGWIVVRFDIFFFLLRLSKDSFQTLHPLILPLTYFSLNSASKVSFFILSIYSHEELNFTINQIIVLCSGCLSCWLKNVFDKIKNWNVSYLNSQWDKCLSEIFEGIN